MNLTSYPGNGLCGEVTLAGDKSLSHRAALFAALAEGESRIDNFQVSGVTQAMLGALSDLGVAWRLEGAALRVWGQGWARLTPPHNPIDCGGSATTLRLLAGALAASGIPAVLDGSPGLRRRPMRRILDPLVLMGVPVSGASGGCAPLTLERRPGGRPLRGIDYRLPVASAQVKSCLLLAGLAAAGPVVLHEPGPSRDHTERLLKAMGCRVETRSGSGDGSTVTLFPPGRPLRPVEMSLPGDLSSAAFLIVAALVTPGSAVRVRNVGLNPTRTGILDALQAMGADLQVHIQGEQAGEPFGEVLACSSQLAGAQVAGDLVVRMIDEFPIFAVAACFARGTTDVRDAGELRYKESDRIAVLCQELQAIGGEITERPDGFTIQGGPPLRGGTAESHGDHRLAMSLAVAGLAAQTAVSVQGAEAISESFPGFTEALRSLGARLEEEGANGES